MTIEVLENGAERFVTAGGVAITRRTSRHALRRRDRGLYRRAERAARRGVLVELRVSRPLHALGYGNHRSADRDFGARPRHAHRGAERARRDTATDHRQGSLRTEGCDAHPDLEATACADDRRTGPDFHRGGAQPRPVGVHGAARNHRAVQERPGFQPRPLRRVRLRPRLPVRPGRLFAEARRKPARPRALPARRDSRRRPSPGARPGTTATTIPAAASRPKACRATARRSRSGRPTASRRAATTNPANTPSSSPRRWRVFGAATCSRSCPARCSTSAAKRRRPRFRVG